MADGNRIGHSPAVLTTLRRLATTLDDVALYRTGNANVWTPSEDVGAEHLSASWISASMLRLLQTPPLIGRSFSNDEERRGGPEAVILSESEWRARFDGAPEVIGKTLVVNDVPREIVGVMPAQFTFPAAGIRIWLPAKHADSAAAGNFFYAAVARLTDEASIEQAQEELGAVLPRMAELFPQLISGGSTSAWLEEVQLAPRLQALRAAVTSDIAPTLWVLACLAALVLLVAWANVANLALIRAEGSRQEAAICEALGASPMRAWAHVLGEAGLLGATAAVLALLATLGALAALKAFGPADLPRLAEIGMGRWTVAVIVLGALLSTFGWSLLLTWLDRPRCLSSRLRGGGRGQTSDKPRQRLRAAVAVLQIAVALIVLAGSALLLRTAHRLNAVHPGFEAEQVTSFRILLPYARYGDSARVAFHAQLSEQVSQLSGVLAAGLTAHLPLGPGGSPEQDFRIDGKQLARSAVNVVGNGYFEAMRIPLLAGRDFQPLSSQRAAELILSARAARQYFADPTGSHSLGKTLTLDPGGPTYRVVGVVGDVHYADLALAPTAMVYRPQVVASVPATEPGPLPAMNLVVRSNIPPDALVAAVRGIVGKLDPSVPLFEISSMSEVVRQSMARLTLMLALTSAAAVVTLLLGMIGLYGLLAYLVALRSREFGLRMALGADPRRIVRSVLSSGLTLTAAGVIAGLTVFALTLPYLRASILGIRPWEPLPLAAASLLLSLTAALACWLPARRAAAVDPASSLRAE
jgi:predicted permease